MMQQCDFSFEPVMKDFFKPLITQWFWRFTDGNIISYTVYMYLYGCLSAS